MIEATLGQSQPSTACFGEIKHPVRFIVRLLFLSLSAIKRWDSAKENRLLRPRTKNRELKVLFSKEYPLLCELPLSAQEVVAPCLQTICCQASSNVSPPIPFKQREIVVRALHLNIPRAAIGFVVCKNDRIERQRLRALAELHASIHIQRTWRGARGRDAAFRRAATIAFARETAERYIKPDRFAVANLRAFNAHGGFLGTAGVDARFLLAAAVGLGGERQGASAKQNRRDRFDGSGRNRNGEEACGGDDGGGRVWLRLKPYGVDDWGLSADARVAGIVEVGIRVGLERCNSSRVVAGALPPPGTPEGGESAQVEMEGTNGYGDIRDVPPMTLKLELISIQSGSCVPSIKDSSEERSRIATAVAPHGAESDDDSSRASSDYASGEGSSYGSESSRSTSTSSSEKRRRPRDRSISEQNSGSSDSSAQSGRRNSETTDESSGGGSDNDVSKQSGRTCATATNSDDSNVNGGSHKARRRSSGRGLKNGSHLYDCGELDKEQHMCEVTWCGETVGGTRAPLVGLPTPRWEGQVCYLPLCAAANEKTAAAASKQVNKDLYGAGHQITGGGCWAEENLHRQGAGGQEEACESPAPLLVVTLNKLSSRTGGRFPCNGVNQEGRRGCGSSADKTTWSAFVSGLIHPLPVGRAVLEAGDVLSMLGSQQVRSRSESRPVLPLVLGTTLKQHKRTNKCTTSARTCSLWTAHKVRVCPVTHPTKN